MTTPSTSTPTNPFAREDVLALDARALDAALHLDAPSAGWAQPSADVMTRVPVKNGVAVVRVRGMLCASDWWGETYPDVLERVGAAIGASEVRAVVLALDSPGGTTSGLFDAMRRLRTAKAAAAAAGKRLVAHVATQATSAAYGLASCCEEVVIDETACVGSIGVLSTLSSRVDQLAQEGVDVRVIASGAEKTDGHPAVPISEAAVARAQERVAALAELFFSEIAAGRPSLTVDAQRALEAGVRYGRQAIAAGLADRVGTLDALLASLAPAAPAPPPTTFAPRTGAMTTRTTMNEALAALIAAKTGETDPERQLGALQALLAKADAHDALAAELGAQRAKAEGEAFEREVAAGLAAKKLSDAEASWWREERVAGRATAQSLNANLAHRAAPSLPAADPSHLALEAPQETPRQAAASPRVAALLARPYGALSWDERNELAHLDREAHARVYDAWVHAGRPKA